MRDPFTRTKPTQRDIAEKEKKERLLKMIKQSPIKFISVPAVPVSLEY